MKEYRLDMEQKEYLEDICSYLYNVYILDTDVYECNAMLRVIEQVVHRMSYSDTERSMLNDIPKYLALWGVGLPTWKWTTI